MINPGIRTSGIHGNALPHAEEAPIDFWPTTTTEAAVEGSRRTTVRWKTRYLRRECFGRVRRLAALLRTIERTGSPWSCAIQPSVSMRTGAAPTSAVSCASRRASWRKPICRSHLSRNSSKMASPCRNTSKPSLVTPSRVRRAPGAASRATYPRACSTAIVFAAACFETDRRRPSSEALPAPAAIALIAKSWTGRTSS
jgi:hypothetical protein